MGTEKGRQGDMTCLEKWVAERAGRGSLWCGRDMWGKTYQLLRKDHVNLRCSRLEFGLVGFGGKKKKKKGKP